MLTLTASAHHGTYRATASAQIDDHLGSHDDIVRQICEHLQTFRDDTTALGAYVPAAGLVWHQIARQLIHLGSAEHGWVRYALSDD